MNFETTVLLECVLNSQSYKVRTSGETGPAFSFKEKKCFTYITSIQISQNLLKSIW